MKTTPVLGLLAILIFSGCGGLQVAGQVQAGRSALQTGRPQDAVAYLAPAAAADPGYRIPYRLGVNVLTYLGRAYYETGRDREAQSTLEKSVEQAPENNLARVYLGLVQLRSGAATGRQQVDSGLKGLHEILDYLASDHVYGPFWDPAGSLRSEIRTALASKTTDAPWIASVERIGREFDEEIDEARRDEVRTRSRSSGGGE